MSTSSGAPDGADDVRRRGERQAGELEEKEHGKTSVAAALEAAMVLIPRTALYLPRGANHVRWDAGVANAEVWFDSVRVAGRSWRRSSARLGKRARRRAAPSSPEPSARAVGRLGSAPEPFRTRIVSRILNMPDVWGIYEA